MESQTTISKVHDRQREQHLGCEKYNFGRGRNIQHHRTPHTGRSQELSQHWKKTKANRAAPNTAASSQRTADHIKKQNVPRRPPHQRPTNEGTLGAPPTIDLPRLPDGPPNQVLSDSGCARFLEFVSCHESGPFEVSSSFCGCTVAKEVGRYGSLHNPSVLLCTTATHPQQSASSVHLTHWSQ